MEFVTVISHIKDEKFNSHPNDSEIWKHAYHPEEFASFTEQKRGSQPAWYEYVVQFNGLTPLQITKPIKEI